MEGSVLLYCLCDLIEEAMVKGAIYVNRSRLYKVEMSRAEQSGSECC